MLKLSEKELQNSILEYVNLRGHFCWRNNTGAFKTASGGFYRMGAVGSPDIIGVSREGRFIGIEVKVGYNKPSPAQLNFIKQIRDRGGIGIIAYKFDDIVGIL